MYYQILKYYYYLLLTLLISIYELLFNLIILIHTFI